AFATNLSENERLKMETINRHVGRLGFFAENYLYHHDAKLQKIHSGHILDFLGDYYICRVFNSTKSDITPYLASFKKFSKFAYENGYLDKEDFDKIKMVC